MSMTVFVSIGLNESNKEVVNLQKTDQFLKIFEVMAGRVGIEVQHVRILYQGKTYRHDQLEVKKPITDIAANPRPNFIMVSRLPGGI